MKTRNRVTLGLLIFFLGALMAACGGNEAAAPAAVNDECYESCEKVYDGRFRIKDPEEYLDTFDYESSSKKIFDGDGFFDDLGNELIDEVASSIADPVVAAVKCGGKIFITEKIADLFGIDDLDVECSTVDTNFSDSFLGETEDIGTTSPRAQAEYAIYRNDVEAIRLTIESDLGTDQMVFDATNNEDIFESRNDSNILLYRRSGHLELANSGVLVGYFED